MKDYIPGADHAFLSWSTGFLTNLTPLVAQLKLPQDITAALTTQRQAFANKLTIADNEGTRTKVTVKEKNDARTLFEGNIRQTVKEYLTNNHLMTDAIRDLLGLPIPDTKPTPAPAATTYPWTKALTAVIREVGFDYGSSETSKAKPAGQHGMELASVIADTKPAEVDELIHSSFSTHTPLVLNFKESERGKTLWYAVRWENTRGIKGPWSEIMSVVIP
jgi:hypothetical protein